MGASSSTDNKESSKKREIESLTASTGALPLLQRSFSKLVDSQTNTVSFESFKAKYFAQDIGAGVGKSVQVLMNGVMQTMSRRSSGSSAF